VFQPVDDMLDFSARQTELSKSIGDDFRGGKITLPILLAFTRGDEKERTLGRRALDPRDLVAAGGRARRSRLATK